MTEKEYTMACNAGLIYPKETVQIEAFTNMEQRIFLVAMCREKIICKNVDELFPDGENLVRICEDIERKVKKTLWTTADVVEVVRCKDCESYDDCAMWCDYNDIRINDHGFCSNGERRESHA